MKPPHRLPCVFLEKGRAEAVRWVRGLGEHPPQLPRRGLRLELQTGVPVCAGEREGVGDAGSVLAPSSLCGGQRCVHPSFVRGGGVCMGGRSSSSSGTAGEIRKRREKACEVQSLGILR